MIFYSSIEPIYFLLPVIGLVVGLFSTVVGGGGGFFFLPALTLILGVPAQTAVITSLVATLPIGMVGVLGHHKRGNVDFKMGLVFSIFGVVGAFVGAYFTSVIDAEVLKSCFGVYAFFLAANMIYGSLKKSAKREVLIGVKHTQHLRNIKSAFFGFSGGTISGSFGTSGTGPVLAGLLSMQIPLKMVIGTSLFIVTMNALSAISAHMLVGHIDLTLIGFLTVGSLLGSLIGPKLISQARTENKEGTARYIYAFVLVVIGLLMVIK